MSRPRSIGVAVVGVLLYGTVSAAQDFDRYREFELGSTVASVSALTGIVGVELKSIHQRPAVIQELTWRPKYAAHGSVSPQSVEKVVFDFYDDRLFRVTVDYDRQQTEGLMDADMIEAISVVYGRDVKPVVSKTPAVYDNRVTAVAAWGNVGHSVTLYRVSSYASNFSLVVVAEPTAALARTAAARAGVLDDREAPQREAAREKKEADDRRLADEKARVTNKAVFQP